MPVEIIRLVQMWDQVFGMDHSYNIIKAYFKTGNRE